MGKAINGFSDRYLENSLVIGLKDKKEGFKNGDRTITNRAIFSLERATKGDVSDLIFWASLIGIGAVLTNPIADRIDSALLSEAPEIKKTTNTLKQISEPDNGYYVLSSD